MVKKSTTARIKRGLSGGIIISILIEKEDTISQREVRHQPGEAKGVSDEVLYLYRKHVGVSQGELAKEVGVTQVAVWRIEHGGGLKAETAYAIARALENRGLDFVEVLTTLCNPATRTKKRAGDVPPDARPKDFQDKESISDEPQAEPRQPAVS